MTTVEVRIRYYAHDFWLHPALLGWRRAFERAGTMVEIQFPASPEEFQANEHEQETEPTLSTFPVATLTEPGWDNETAAVRLFCVVVRFVTELPRTAAGKFLKSALRSRYQGRFSGESSASPA